MALVAKLSVTEARERFTSLSDQFASSPDLTVQVTKHGRPVMAMLAWDTYEAIVETLEVMADPDLMAALRQSAEDLARGNVADWDAIKAELGL